MPQLKILGQEPGRQGGHSLTKPTLLPLRVAERLGRLTTWALEQDLAPRELAVLLTLLKAGDKNLSSWCAHKTLGERANLSSRSVARAVESLVEKGLVHRKVRFERSGGRTSDLLTVVAPSDVARLRTSQKELATNGGYGPDLGEYPPDRLAEELFTTYIEEVTTNREKSSPDRLSRGGRDSEWLPLKFKRVV